MIASSMKGKLFVLAVFILGIVTGALFFNVYETRLSGADNADARNRKQRAERDVNTFYDYLGVNAKQRTEIHKIMEESQADFRALAQQTRPQYDAIREETRNRVRALLNDEQKRKYDEFRNKMQQRGQRPPRPKN